MGNIIDDELHTESEMEEVFNYLYGNEKFYYYSVTKNCNIKLIIDNELKQEKKKEYYKIKKIKTKWIEILKMTKISTLKDHKFYNRNLTINTKYQQINNTNIGSGVIIQALCAAYNFNKYRYVKYMMKGILNNMRWLTWISVVVSNKSCISKAAYDKIIKEGNLDKTTEDQIQKDLYRSASQVSYFQNKEGINSLYNILKVISLVDYELGYCQGMNTICAYALLVSDGNDYEAFNFIDFLFTNYKIREFYLEDFPKLNLYIFIIENLMKERLPDILNKINELEMPKEVWIFKWIQSLYLNTFNFSIAIRLWDCIIAYGLEFIINFTLALLKHFEKDILKCKEMEEFLKIFSQFNEFSNEKEILYIREKLIKKAKKITITGDCLRRFKVLYDVNKNKLCSYNINNIYTVINTTNDSDNNNNKIINNDFSYSIKEEEKCLQLDKFKNRDSCNISFDLEDKIQNINNFDNIKNYFGYNSNYSKSPNFS